MICLYFYSQALEEWLPREYWMPLNELLVGFGQTMCKYVCSVRSRTELANQAMSMTINTTPQFDLGLR